MRKKTTFIGKIRGERQVPVSSIDTTFSGSSPADDATYSACVATNNAVIDLLADHQKTHGFRKVMFKTFKVDVDYVDTDDEDEFVEWEGDFLFPTSGRIEYAYLIEENRILDFVSTLPTELTLDGDTISIDWWGYSFG